MQEDKLRIAQRIYIRRGAEMIAEKGYTSKKDIEELAILFKNIMEA